MVEMLRRLSNAHLIALHRCAKTRGLAFFGPPRHMMALRTELEARGLAPWRLE